MKIRSIVAQKDRIVLQLDGCSGKTLTVNAHVPLVCGKEDKNFVPGRVVATFTVLAEEETAAFPRSAAVPV